MRIEGTKFEDNKLVAVSRVEDDDGHIFSLTSRAFGSAVSTDILTVRDCVVERYIQMRCSLSIVAKLTSVERKL